jgi:hypothetical protein
MDTLTSVCRHIFECAAHCTNMYYCSAFQFVKESQMCYLGSQDGLNFTATNIPDQTISVHTNPDFNSQGWSTFKSSKMR